MKRTLVLLFVLLLLSACAPALPKGTQVLTPNYPASVKTGDYAGRRTLRQDNPIDENYSSLLTGFGSRTASVLLQDTEGNALYSPLSLAYALTLATAGAKGETQAELLAALGADDPDTFTIQNLVTQSGNLWRILCCDNEYGRLSIASSLWINAKNTLCFSPAFVELTQNQLYASLYRVDFTAELDLLPALPRLMQDWVKDNTSGQIVPIPTALSPDAGLVLFSTLDFSGEWTDRFEKNKTEAGVFHAASGDKTVDFMNETYSIHSFARGENFTRSGLSTKNGATMYFVLPDMGTDIDALLSSPETLEEALFGGESGHGEVVWAIPKFDFTAELDLLPALRALGVKSAFDQKSADFSGIYSEPLPEEMNLYLSAVNQQNRISVDERGIEAASFTRIDFAGAPMPDGRAEMILDRPFLFAVIRQNVPLFIGVCREG